VSVSAFGDTFCLTLLTNDPGLASRGDQAGVNRIGVDLERLGKAERQVGEDTRLSEHSWEDLAKIAQCLAHAALFVRLNPLNENTSEEINTSLQCGAKILMLPFFRTADEVRTFVHLVDRRGYVVILLETAAGATHPQYPGGTRSQ
jgi:citrate lyase beta subunit